ncbi:SEC-C metal-binding domain-containing protein [Kribbella yunnanensis]|uniref:SEC-C metal-binding domain-containing protein n=1 Tax=Kribbella yunnanensis TaxID=190194 RepID=A0ABN2GUF0_9ACTN
MPYDAVLESAAEILAARGPLTDDQLFAELDSRGVDLGPLPVDGWTEALDEVPDSQIVLLGDGRWGWLPSLLAGRVFVRRVTDVEAAHDLLFLTPDLTAAALLFETEDARLLDGTPVELIVVPFEPDKLAERGVSLEAVTDYEVVLLPAGHWSSRNVRSGDLIALRISGEGLALEAPDAPVDAKATTAVVQALTAVLDRREPEQLDTAIWTVCAEDPELFREPLPPLDELFAANGLTRLVDWVAREDFDFAAWRMNSRLKSVMDRFELDDDEALAVLAATGMYEQMADGTLLDGLTGQIKELLALLDEPIVVSALLVHTTGYEADRAAPLGLLTEALEPLMPRTTRPALRWLRAKTQELQGDIATAEQTLLSAESLDPDWPLAAFDLARYAFDRGDATRGLSLLRRIGAPDDDPMLQALERYDATPRVDIGRNDACWCGSGQKYKKCHLTNRGLPLEERARWLYQKAERYLDDPPRQILYDQLGDLRAEYAETDDELEAALSDPLIADVLLFEGGLLEDFLSTRGVLLPDDEQLLAQQWLLTSRSVHEVTDVRAGENLTLRDLRTGDIQQVRERTASTALIVGELICARVAAAGDTTQIFGGIEPVDLRQRDELIALLDSEPMPDELVEFLTRRFAPAVLQNTDGDPLVFCEASLRTEDPVALSKLLDEQFDRGDPREPTWIEHAMTDDLPRISATLRLSEDILQVETNSERRHQRIVTTIRELMPAIVLVSESRRPARDAREMAALAAGPTHDRGAVAGPADPATAAVLEEFVLEYEKRWLTEPIPALSGFTPRQAAADPTRRDDLIRLLASFPEADGPGTMSPARLRAALDLPAAGS